MYVMPAKAASERTGNNLKGFKDFDLNAKAIIWRWPFNIATFARPRLAVSRNEIVYLLRWSQRVSVGRKRGQFKNNYCKVPRRARI